MCRTCAHCFLPTAKKIPFKVLRSCVPKLKRNFTQNSFSAQFKVVSIFWTFQGGIKKVFHSVVRKDAVWKQERFTTNLNEKKVNNLTNDSLKTKTFTACWILCSKANIIGIISIKIINLWLACFSENIWYKEPVFFFSLCKFIKKKYNKILKRKINSYLTRSFSSLIYIKSKRKLIIENLEKRIKTHNKSGENFSSENPVNPLKKKGKRAGKILDFFSLKSLLLFSKKNVFFVFCF